MHILHVVGARPNFMKVAPVIAALEKRESIRQTLVHTGQHYDENMSRVFFDQLGIPKPDISLGVGSGSHAVQTANTMIKLEETLIEKQPDMVLVYGDINSTVAASLVAAKLSIPVTHVEAGLRSRDLGMPEEINRLVTDVLSTLHLTPSRDGDENLMKEGISPAKIHCVGNVMIDTLVRLLPQAELPDIDGVQSNYALVTLHRPSNVDEPEMLAKLLKTFDEISRDCKIIFPVHPRTRQRIASLDIDLDLDNHPGIVLCEPQGYLQFLALQKNATVVITDSGGIQEETTYLQIPCLTMRENTERPVTVDVGTNVLIGRDCERLKSQVKAILSGHVKRGRIPELWDGHSGERIAEILVNGDVLQDALASSTV